MEEILSTANSYVKYAASLQESKFRKTEGKYLIEGAVTLKEALQTAQDVECVFVSQEYGGEIPEGADRYVSVPAHVLKKISATVEPQGIVAIVRKPFRTLTVCDGNCLVLDGVSDPGNMGTIIRTAAACGIKTVYAIKCVDAYNPKVVRSSMTGIFYSDVIECEREYVTQVLSKTHCITVADMQGKSVFEQSFLQSNYALVIGNEAHGVSDELKNSASLTVSLPMQNVESLNAAISAAVITYQITFGNRK